MEAKSVMLANPHFPVRTYPGAPMGLFMIKSALEKAGARSSVFDCDPMGGAREFKRQLEAEKPSILGVTSLSFQINEAAWLARIAKNVDPKITVILGGPHAMVGWKEVLEDYPAFDMCCVGRGEDPMVELAKGMGLEQIKGLAYRNGGRIILGGPRPWEVDINQHIPDRFLHFPSYDFKILYHSDDTPLKTAQSMLTLGCPHNCVFCSEPIRARMAGESEGFKVLRRSPGSVKAEMRELKTLGYEFVYFDDSTFTLSKEYALKVSKIMGEVGLLWGCNTRVDAVDYKLASEMAKDGCRYMFCGFESAVPEVLLSMRKTANPDYYLKCAKETYGWLGELGFDRMAYIIFGGPRMNKDGSITIETPDDARRSVDFVVNELKPTSISPSGFRLLPGTTASTDTRYSLLWPEGKPITARTYHRGIERIGPMTDRLEGAAHSVTTLNEDRSGRIIEMLLEAQKSGVKVNFND
ncbi:MAG: radical SAM protein [Candidatus Micrarchaeota archaeon]